MRKALTYWALLIGAYIIVANATGFGKALGAGSKGVVDITNALHGKATG